MTGSGTIDTNCNCTATVPSDTLCPAPPPDPTCADLGMVGIYPACTAPPDPTCADYGQVGVWPACTDPDPGCTPDNSCAAGTCMGSTCSDSCGNSYGGTMFCGGGCVPDNSCAAATCGGDTCTDACGNTYGGTMVCAPVGVPNLTQPSVSYTPSAAFDPATGNYNSVNISFQTSNNGGVDAGSSQYRLWFDNRGTTDIDTTGTLGAISVSTNVTRSHSATNVPFGPITIRVLVDSNNSVAESNEGDNERTVSATLPAPDPGLIISADRVQVRNQETVQLSWDTRATYAMNCIVAGPGIAPITFDPHISGATGSQQSAPLNAKSEFTLRCVEPITNTTFTDSVVIETTGKIEEI